MPDTPDRSHLTLVPSGSPTPAEETRRRVRAMPKPDGMMQCSRCGGRLSITGICGAFVKNGRRQGGTEIMRDVCAYCWKQGIEVSMHPDFKPI